MRRLAILVVCGLLVVSVVVGAALVIWKVRALTRPQAEYLIRSELSLASGFGGARVERFFCGWDTATADTTIVFGIRDFKTQRVAAKVAFVRIGGSWRISGVTANDRIYASLMDLATQEMAALRLEYSAHLAEVTVRTGQVVGEAVVETAESIGTAIANAWREWNER